MEKKLNSKSESFITSFKDSIRTKAIDLNFEEKNKINELLDDQIRPFLQNDGGDVYVVGLEGNKLSVHYQGACGSCPSSLSGTLTGIENLVRQIETDIEVVAV